MISQSNNTDKRQRILEAALKLFVELGFHATPTSKIAQEAGVANGTLFHYFKTKEELVVALYIDAKERLANYTIPYIKPSDDVKQRSKAVLVGALSWAMENRADFHFIEQFHTSPFLSLISPEEIKRQASFHLALIQEGIDAGLVKKMPVDFLYTIISSQMFGIYQYLAASPLTSEEQQEVISNSFDMLWKMIS